MGKGKGLLGAPMSECVAVSEAGDVAYHWIFVHDQAEWRTDAIRRMERCIPSPFNNVLGVFLATGEARLKYATVREGRKKGYIKT